MRVLVTGGAGFLGSHVVDHLLAEGCQVTVLDDLSTGLTTNVPNGVRLLKVDVQENLVEAFAAVNPNAVVHLAAQVSVPRSLSFPYLDLSVNTGGTVRVMEAAARTNVRKVVAVSSAAVYGVPDTLPVREDSCTQALSPYGLSKLTAEHYVRMLGQAHGVAYTILRPANLFGPRQETEGEGAVVPAFLQRFLHGKDPLIQGDGSQTRDFLYVSDMARAIGLCLTRGDGLTLNISSGSGLSILSLWQLLASLLYWDRPPVFGPAREGDIAHSRLSNERAREVLDWVPQVGMAEGLATTIAWNTMHFAAATRSAR